MEPDETLYRPFLEPLLSKPNTTLIPKSGILWKELSDVWQYLPHQADASGLATETSAPTRNDTLLVTANLASHPKKRYRTFDSMAVMFMYQLLSSIKTGSLFQKYGLVRMLVWMNDEDKRTFLPHCAQKRMKSAMTAEFSCDWMTEIAGMDRSARNSPSAKTAVRDSWLDMESGHATLRRMADAGVSMPQSRETNYVQRLLKMDPDIGRNRTGESKTPWLERPYLSELKDLEGAHAASEFARGSTEYKRLTNLRTASKKAGKDAHLHVQLLQERDAIADLREAGITDEATIQVRERIWNDKVRALGKNIRIDFRQLRDNLHIFQQTPPVLHWDRRSVEPLAVQSTEFFPNIECCLLDIQPKAMHPLLREMGPNSSRAGDMFELMLGSLVHSSVDPLSKALESLWPGAPEGIIPHCPSLRERSLGGMPGAEYAELCPRVLNERQWMEILGAWMKWPFRPSYHDMVARLEVSEGTDFAEENPNIDI
jgi:mitochondrial transcription factor 1